MEQNDADDFIYKITGFFFWYWLKYTYWEKNPDLELIFPYRRDCAT